MKRNKAKPSEPLHFSLLPLTCFYLAPKKLNKNSFIPNGMKLQLHGSTRIDKKLLSAQKFLTALNRLTLNLYGQHSGAVAIENRQIFRLQLLRNSLQNALPSASPSTFYNINKIIISQLIKKSSEILICYGR